MSQEPEVDLYCCPFCGVSVLLDEKHSEACFFTLSEKLRGSSGQDVFLIQKVADAWKRRVAPKNHKLLKADVSSSALSDFYVAHRGGFNVAGKGQSEILLKSNEAAAAFSEIFMHEKCAWTSKD